VALSQSSPRLSGYVFTSTCTCFDLGSINGFNFALPFGYITSMIACKFADRNKDKEHASSIASGFGVLKR
jgi:hypothetical protein